MTELSFTCFSHPLFIDPGWFGVAACHYDISIPSQSLATGPELLGAEMVEPTEIL